jgi:lysozyme
MSLIDMLIRHEGLRLKVYDDANGSPLIPGYTLKGHATIGVGRNVEHVGITKEEALDLLMNDIRRCEKEAVAAFPWYIDLDSTRKDVIISMVFNLGLTRLMGFRKMIKAMEDKNYEEAADQMLDSVWAEQVGKRAEELSRMMRLGKYLTKEEEV